MKNWKEVFRNQTMSVHYLKAMFYSPEAERGRKVIMRSDAVTIVKMAVIQTYEDLIEKLSLEDGAVNVIIKDLEEFRNKDISALGM